MQLEKPSKIKCSKAAGFLKLLRSVRRQVLRGDHREGERSTSSRNERDKLIKWHEQIRVNVRRKQENS